MTPIQAIWIIGHANPRISRPIGKCSDVVMMMDWSKSILNPMDIDFIPWFETNYAVHLPMHNDTPK